MGTDKTARDRKWRYNRKWRHFPPRFFLTIVVVQNVPLHEKLEDTKGIIRSRKSNDKQQWDILYYYYSKKKARENDVTSCDVTFGYSFGHVTDVTSDDVTSGSTPFPNYDGLQVLKTVKYWSNPSHATATTAATAAILTE